MNSIWNKNLSLFKNRFPSLFSMLSRNIAAFEKSPEALSSFWKISSSKNGSFTAEENGRRLHSAYNPEREAETLISSSYKNFEEKNSAENKAESLVLLGFGLGYSVQAAASFLHLQKNPGTLIVVEPDVNHFLASLNLLDWEKVFSLEKLILALSCPPEQLLSILNSYEIQKSVFAVNPVFTFHEEKYFETVISLIERNRRKEKINEATTKKFGRRWNLNNLKNAENAFLSDGISIYKNCGKNLPFTLFAAGPSLAEILPFASEIQKRSVTVCVDTSLRALLSVKVEPDFIIITDPQYWAFRHLTGTKSLSSVLIASQDVYPSVFNYRCRKIVCASSLLPIGKYFEKFSGEKGGLGAGGTVAGSAWNFCESCGALEIYAAGLDLSFPEKQTHIKGSTFEENVHMTSSRFKTAETQGMPLLFSGNPEKSYDYLGNEIITDQRMKMFAWYFESRQEECPHVKTFTFSPHGLNIPGFKTFAVEDFLKKPVMENQKKAFFENAESREILESEKNRKKQEFKKRSAILNQALKGVDLSDFNKVKETAEKL